MRYTPLTWVLEFVFNLHRNAISICKTDNFRNKETRGPKKVTFKLEGAE